MSTVIYNHLMRQPLPGIMEGFGTRLREERSRLGLTQTELGEQAGIQRLAQSQYEAETRTPTVRYLSDIGAAGVDLQYLLFGKANAESHLSATESRSIEQKAFALIEEYVQLRCDGKLSAESRFVMFELLRAQLIQAAGYSADQAADIDMGKLLSSG